MHCRIAICFLAAAVLSSYAEHSCKLTLQGIVRTSTLFFTAFLDIRAATGYKKLTSYVLVPCFSGKLDVVLIIDVSGSSEIKFMINRDAALEVARSLPISWEKTSIAVIQYSKLAMMKLEFGSSTTWETVNDTIANLEWTGDVQKTAEAMDLGMIMFRRSRPEAQRVIILFSDGNSFNTWQEVIDTAERLKYSQAKIFAVSLSGDTYETELKQYVQFSNGSIVRTRSELQQLKSELQSMNTPRCPPPAAAPPQDFLRPAESNPDAQENQLPTRGPGSRNSTPTRKSTRRNTRITRTTTTATTTTTTLAPSGALPNAPAPNPPAPNPPVPNTPPANTPPSVFIDATVDKHRQ